MIVESVKFCHNDYLVDFHVMYKLKHREIGLFWDKVNHVLTFLLLLDKNWPDCLIVGSI